MQTSDVSNLLALACPAGPSGVPSQGAALALACHCIMVQGGFRTCNRPQQGSARGSIWSTFLSGISGPLPLPSQDNVFKPPVDWLGESFFHWEFVYAHSSGPLPVTLTVNVHPETGRCVRGAGWEEMRGISVCDICVPSHASRVFFFVQGFGARRGGRQP